MNSKYTNHFVLMLVVSVASFAAVATNAESNNSEKIEQVVQSVNQYCGACHKVPSPNSMPKKYWPRAVQVMADIAKKRFGQEFISEDIIKDITAYYYGNSQATLPILPYYQNPNKLATFTVSEIGMKSTLPLAINIKSVELTSNSGHEFLICDGEKNQVSLLSKVGSDWKETILANIKVPSHTEVVDFDNDGDKDVLVSALGYFPPSDKLAGKIFLLRQIAVGKFRQELIIEGVGRITDARPVDIDMDGDLDIAVSIFGGGNVGEISWLENLGENKYIKHDLVKVSGALNVSPVDLNADGKIDLVSLIAQEYEMIIALINKGDGKFEQVSLIEAPDPMFGSTGMKLVDLDSDNDIDILFTNGDAHDLQPDPKPYHGIQWLENKGNLNFQYHDIGRFYGAATAVAGDMDSDGDIDVVASSWNNDWRDTKRQSLIWFENDGNQNFSRHNITSRPQSIVSLELKDVTGDDRLDILAAVFRIDLLLNSFEQQNDKEEKPDRSVKEPSHARIVLLENNPIKKTQ